MKQILLTIMLMAYFGAVSAQDISELKIVQENKLGLINDWEAQIKAAQGEIDAIQNQIDVLNGWTKGISGLIGFDWSRSNNWVGNPNPDSRSASLSIDLTGYLNQEKNKTFWHNRASIVKAWTDIDITDAEIENENDRLWDNGTVDILNISSLGGYKLTDKLAISAQAELNSSLGNFLEPGTIDFGLGITWLPIQNMTVMVHPLNYNIAFPATGAIAETSGSLGAKARLDYFLDFVILGSDVNWTTSFSTFFPYTKLDDIELDGGGTFRPKVNSYQWLNNLSFNIWKGVGVGFGWGMRKADFETSDFQYYTNFGISYAIK